MRNLVTPIWILLLAVAHALEGASEPTITEVTPDTVSHGIVRVLITGSDFRSTGTFPDGTISYNGHHYLWHWDFPVWKDINFQNDSTGYCRWDTAEHVCESLGGTLPMVTSVGENDFLMTVYDQTSGAGYGFWLGMNRYSASDGWLWLDGTTATYFNWTAGQPDRLAENRHVGVHMHHFPGTEGEWWNKPTDDANSFMCEFHGSGPLAPTVRLSGPESVAPIATVLLAEDRLLCSFDLRAAPTGDYDIEITNADGGIASKTKALSIDSTFDPPEENYPKGPTTVTIMSPTNSDTFATGAGDLTFFGITSEPELPEELEIPSVHYFLTGATTGEGVASGVDQWQFDAHLSQGVTTLMVVAVDNRGYYATDTMVITVDPNLPIVKITSPSSDGFYATSDSHVDFAGLASDNLGLAEVAYSIVGVPESRGVIAGLRDVPKRETSWSYRESNLRAGSNIVQVSVTDNEGNTSYATIEVRVQEKTYGSQVCGHGVGLVWIVLPL